MGVLSSLVSSRSLRRKAAMFGLGVFMAALVFIRPVSDAGEVQARAAIYANVSSSIEVEAPSEIHWNDLYLGINVSPPQQIRVRSNKQFTIKMRSVTRTHMAEYDLEEKQWITGGKSLSETLMWQWADEESEPTKVSRSDTDIVVAHPPTSDSGTVFKICFVQEIVYSDEHLPEGKAYRIDVVFTAVQDV